MVGSIASGPQVVPDGRDMPSPPGSVSSPVSPAPRVRRGSECSCSSQPPTCHLPAERCNSTGGATVAQLPCRVVGQAAKGLDLTAASCRGSPSVADCHQRHLAAVFSDEPLDLSVRGCCSSSSCSPPPPSAEPRADEDGACSPVLDLSLPDQESPVEVCYTCGLLVRRVTLHAVLALPRGRAPAPREPFFPSLLERRRPAGSRPMAPSGRVRVCGACRQTLLIQWDEYQRSGVVAPEQRVYALRRRRPSDSSCAKCGVLCPTSAAHALCTRCRQEVTGPPLAAPGLPEDSRCSRIIEEAVRGGASLVPPPQPSASTMAERRSRQQACRRCGRQTPRSGLAETRLAARNSSPFSRTGVTLASGTTLVCQSCLRALSRQWRVRQQLPAARTTRSCSRAAAAADATDGPAASSAQLTAGCYACHQPLQSDAAYQVRTEPRNASSSPRLTPYFPHLARQNIALPPAVQTVAVCVFCYHALQDQWRRYERLSRPVAPAHRQYDTHFFACLVCGITTYRKRLHLLEVKDFPFLTKSHRLPERALLVCDGTRAVVCRDCHNTLHSQSRRGWSEVRDAGPLAFDSSRFQDYEKLRLPVDRREYNWVQRPPPPESPSPQATHDTMKLVRVADGGSVLRLSNI